ncbi:hypothetical protein PybrP1_005219 [[Pythium] brassicae (nom. inval.)]|nr:hypothetical protein PybrP1_005219 [[Pythium] brassicae (nom. inval.)]
MAGGVVQSDESFEDNAAREAHEELGVAGVPLTRIDTFYYADARSRVWGATFECVFDGPLVLQAEEVDEVLEMTADEILRSRAEFTPDGIFAFERYLAKVTTTTTAPPPSAS